MLSSLSPRFFPICFYFFFFFHDPPTTEIYTLSLHDALPICGAASPPPPGDGQSARPGRAASLAALPPALPERDRKSTRLNSSHRCISYAVFCLKKKKKKNNITCKHRSVNQEID